MQILNTQVFGWQCALRAIRNPMDSWDLADTPTEERIVCLKNFYSDAPESIGVKDLDLLLKLTKNGTEHRKVLRMIQVWVTWILSRYGWTEADTYKIATTRMSCSTMHKLGHRELKKADFQDEDVDQDVLDKLNCLAKQYRDGDKKDYDLVRKMKRRLPEGFLQRADMNFNYENLLNMFKQRYNHRLAEWAFDISKGPTDSICNWIYSLPYMDVLIKASGKNVVL
jgi:hypothetical protein